MRSEDGNAKVNPNSTITGVILVGSPIEVVVANHKGISTQETVKNPEMRETEAGIGLRVG